MLSLKIAQLAHEYDEREVFKCVDFSYDGACLAVTGSNGSGKSTLLRIIAGLLTPTYGELTISMNGNSITHDSLRNITGMVAPDIRLYSELTTRENLDFLLKVRSYRASSDRISEVIELVGLENRADDPLRELSTGLRQRANFAAALVHKPNLLLLDEPSSNLDDDGITMVRSVIERQRELGMVVLATNDPAEAELADARLNIGAVR